MIIVRENETQAIPKRLPSPSSPFGASIDTFRQAPVESAPGGEFHASKKITLENLGNDEDIRGNNAAFRCPVLACGKVFIATTLTNTRQVKCPKCGGSTVTLEADTGQGAKVLGARIEWD